MTTMHDQKTNEDNKVILMKVIRNIVKEERLKQREIADLLDVKQPRVSDLLSLKYERFSIDILLGYLSKFGFKIRFKEMKSGRRKAIKVDVLKVEKNIEA